uniref:Leucine Rich repeats (2 copies) n=1 Tax=Solibacter usitatus (strain Ellin6076) TaxID=234267 RepID=Q026S1_SOLUE
MAERGKLVISGDQVDDALWRKLESRRDLEELVIWGGAITNDRLEPVSRMTWLTGVGLGEVPVDDGVLVHLQPLRELECLNLAYTGVTGDFTRLLGTPLRDVRLEGCRRTGDACARSLARFPTLRQVEMHMTGLTDDGLAAMAALPLEVLWLGPRITDRGMETIGGFANLRHLDICTHLITDEGVRALAGLQQLQVLWLTRSRVSDASIEVLSQFTGLRELNVNYTEITAQGLARLKLALPECRLVEPD